MMTIKQLEQEIVKLKANIDSDIRQANRFQTQGNYHESTDPDISTFSRLTARKYSQEAEDFEGRIAEYRKQIDALKQDVERLQRERDTLRAQADEKDRQALDILG